MSVEDKPRQRIFRDIGEGACYFLSIVRAAEKFTGQYIDAFIQFIDANARMVIVGKSSVPEVLPDCFVSAPDELMSHLTGAKWTVEKVDAGYRCQLGDVEILRYEWVEKKTGITVTHGHFVLGDGNGNIAYDPFGESMTVRFGNVVSKRIFRRV